AARARMVFASGLGWLEGFPLPPTAPSAGVRWLAVPASAAASEMEVGRDHLSRATYALYKLRGDHAAALPSLASDPDVWLASIEHRRELRKRAVHHGEGLPAALWAEPILAPTLRERLADLAAAEPALRPLLAALSWLHAGHPDRLRTALRAV